jgi:hypothetical protein
VLAKDPTGERGVAAAGPSRGSEPSGLLTTRIYMDLVGKDTFPWFMTPLEDVTCLANELDAHRDRRVAPQRAPGWS